VALLRERVSEIYRTTRCIFLDCDGVIFDSNGFKLEALRHAIAGLVCDTWSEPLAHLGIDGSHS